MKINFDQILLTLEGKMIYDDLKKLKPLTLSKVAQTALLELSKEDTSITSEDKIHRYNLALKICMSKDSEINLETEDISFLKKLIGKLYIPLIVGQAFLMLEGEPTGIIENCDPVSTEVHVDEPVSGRVN